MQQQLTRFNEQLAEQGGLTLQIGMGLHNGKVALGAIGSPGRQEFKVIGALS